MGKSKKLLSWLLVALVCVNLLAVTALAATAVKGPLTLTLTTSREAYAADEQVDMLLTAANSGDAALKELHLEIKIPQGYHLCADSAATLELDTLLPGDSAILAPAMEADKPVTPEPSNPTEPELSLIHI